MDEELSKARKKWTLDFVDLCARVLSKAYSESIEKKV